MAEVLLKPKEKMGIGIGTETGITVEAEVIRPDVFAEKMRSEIEGLPVWQGPAKLPLGEFFDVEIQGNRENGSSEETTIIIEGDVSRVKRIGQDMKTGKIEVLGSAGMHLGAEMVGGSILVRGDVGSWAGMEMKGGLIRILGNVGDHVGSAYRGSWRGMTGGQGLVGGQIVVEGNVENFCAIRQSGGIILVKGSAVRGVGAEMTGGTLAVCGEISRLTPGFMEVGLEENPLLGDLQLEGRFTKFTGDYAVSKNPKGSLYWKEV